MTKESYIFCNVETFVLHTPVVVVKDGEEVFTQTVLMNDLAKTAVKLAYDNDIAIIYIAGNRLYAETVRRYIHEENIVNYKNKTEIKVEVV